MIINLTERDHILARFVAVGRHASVGFDETINSQNFFKDRDHVHRGYIGALGEIGFEKYSGLEMEYFTYGGDDGTDFDYSIQVKCSDAKNKPNLMFPLTQYHRKHAEYYILTWYRNNALEIIGYTTRGYIDNNHKLKEYGHGATVFVPNKELELIETFKILKDMPRQKYKQPIVNTNDQHYAAFKWCDENGIRIYPKPRNGKFILVYVVNNQAHTTNKLHDPKDYQQAIWDFYLFLYNKLKND